MTAQNGAPVREIWSLFKPVQTASLATVEGDSPRVRPVELVHHDRRLWVAVGTQTNMVKQLMLNPNIEFHFPVGNRKSPGYVRCTGSAEIVEERETRATVAEAMPFFGAHWEGADDANFTLLRLRVEELEYMKPGEWIPRRDAD